jgi:predicted small secreted protein
VNRKNIKLKGMVSRMKNKMMIITALSLVAALCFSGCSVSESVVEDITSAAEKIE